MYRISLTLSEKELLESKIKSSSNSWITKRYQTILMRNDGLPSSQIASYMSTDVNTVTNWVKLYLSGGFEKLETLNLENRRVSKLDAYLDQITTYVKETEVISINQLQTWLAKEHKLSVEESWLRKWCKKKDLAIKRPV